MAAPLFVALPMTQREYRRRISASGNNYPASSSNQQSAGHPEKMPRNPRPPYVVRGLSISAAGSG